MGPTAVNDAQSKKLLPMKITRQVNDKFLDCCKLTLSGAVLS